MFEKEEEEGGGYPYLCIECSATCQNPNTH